MTLSFLQLTDNVLHPFLPTTQRVVYYHRSCFDGIASAAVAFQCWGNEETIYIPWEYGEKLPPLELHQDKHVFLLDLSFTDDDLTAIAGVAKNVMVIDHHPNAHRQNGLTFANAMDHLFPKNVLILTPTEENPAAGVQLVWRFLMQSRPEPNWVRWIGKRDRWIFDEPEIEPFTASLVLMGWKVEEWADAFDERGGKDQRTVVDLLRCGDTILAYRGTQIDYILEHCQTRMTIDGHNVVAVNAPRFLASDVAEALYERYTPEESPFVAVYYEEHGKVRYSLRARPGSAIDLNEIAKKFGGGGHRTAAGFKVTIHRAPLEPRALVQFEQITKEKIGLGNVPNTRQPGSLLQRARRFIGI